MNYDEENLLGKKILSYFFYLYGFCRYVSYGFPIINFCNPGVHYETPCIMNNSVILKVIRTESISGVSVSLELKNTEVEPVNKILRSAYSQNN
jgi:hypothetical protein